MRWLEFLGKRIGSRAEGNDVKTVLGIEVLQDIAERILRLAEFLPIHAAGFIEHEKNILGHTLALFAYETWRSEQKEEAMWIVALRFLESEQVKANILTRNGVVQIKVFVRSDVEFLISDGESVRTIPVDGDLMRRGINCAYGLR